VDGRQGLCDPSRVADDEAMPVAAEAHLEGLDDESRRWLDHLRSDGPDRPDAIQALFDRLHRVARHEAQRRRGSLPARVANELDDIARQAAGDAMVTVLQKLDDYRGASRFTTWVYKFAIFEVSAALRREAWRGRSLTIDDDAWDRLADTRPVDPHAQTDARELLAAVERSVAADLTPRQRDVFVAICILEVPVDVVAERHGSTRGATYKVLHDARHKLRRALSSEGWDIANAGGAP